MGKKGGKKQGSYKARNAHSEVGMSDSERIQSDEEEIPRMQINLYMWEFGQNDPKRFERKTQLHMIFASFLSFLYVN